MPGMPEILARGGMLGINFLLEPRLLVARMRRSRNLKICLQRMQNTLRRSPLSPVSKSLTRNPCMLTKIGNVAEMSSGTESCPIVHQLGPKI